MKVQRFPLLIVVGAFFLAPALTRCVTVPPAPDLERGLLLEAEFDTSEVRAGQSFLATFTVRNVTAEPIETCIDGDGVSVRLRSPDGTYTWPVISFGIHLDAMCPNETRLEPGEAKVYRERIFTLVDFPADRAIVEASLALKQHPKFRTGPGKTYFGLKNHSEIRVKPFTAP